MRSARFRRLASVLAPVTLLASLSVACGDAPPPVHAPSATAATAPRASAANALPPEFAGKRARTATSARGMVVSDAALATKVGAEMLEAGGNAVDASIALAFALAVVFPTAGNLGGGGFALVHPAAGPDAALDFRETAPSAVTPATFGKNEGGMNAPSRFGHLASGTPGSVAGLYALYEKLGSKKKKWSDLLAPAIRFAEEGFVVDEDFNHAIGFVAQRLAKFPASAALFLPGGAAPAVGSTFKNPELAAVLRRIATEGPAGFYRGPTAEALAAEMKRGGGLISTDDLAGYEAKWRTPVTFQYRGHRVTSMPPPSSGGLTLAMMSSILEPYPLPEMGWHSSEEIHLLAEASRRAFAARNTRLGDPDFVKNPTDELLSKAWADEQRASISREKATSSSSLGIKEKGSGEGPHTTHFSVVDGDGSVVSLTTTLNWWFGSGVTVPGAGFVMNNEMDDFAIVPGTANTFGLVQGEQNAVAPKKRMLSSMSPTIVQGPDGHVELVLGAAGGPTIISAVMQIFSSVVDHKVDLALAEAAPRYHHQALPDLLAIEKGGLTDEQRTTLTRMGHAFKERDHIADAPSIGWDPSAKVWVGAPETRRSGTLAAGPAR